jgi:hypothetical protein
MCADRSRTKTSTKVQDASYCVGESQRGGIRGMQPGAPLTPSCAAASLEASRGICIGKLEKRSENDLFRGLMMPCLRQKPRGHCVVCLSPTSYGLRLLPVDGRKLLVCFFIPPAIVILLVDQALVETSVGDCRTACTPYLSHAYSLRMISQRETHLRHVDDDRTRSGTALTLALWAWSGLCT